MKSILQYSAFGFFAFLLLAFFLLFYLLVTREFVFSFGPRFADLYSCQFAFLFFFCGMCFFQFSFDLRKSPCFISFSNSLLRSRLPPLDFFFEIRCFVFLSNNFFNMRQQRSFTRLKPRLPFLLMFSELSVKSILQYSAFGFFAFLLLAFFLKSNAIFTELSFCTVVIAGLRKHFSVISVAFSKYPFSVSRLSSSGIGLGGSVGLVCPSILLLVPLLIII